MRKTTSLMTKTLENSALAILTPSLTTPARKRKTTTTKRRRERFVDPMSFFLGCVYF